RADQQEVALPPGRRRRQPGRHGHDREEQGGRPQGLMKGHVASPSGTHGGPQDLLAEILQMISQRRGCTEESAGRAGADDGSRPGDLAGWGRWVSADYFRPGASGAKGLLLSPLGAASSSENGPLSFSLPLPLSASLLAWGLGLVRAGSARPAQKAPPVTRSR